jgi:hypothetical protein
MMAELPPPINHTTEAIYRAIAARARPGDSRGVPMSEAANECDRAIFYRLRWAAKLEEIDGQKERRFETGRREETRLLDDLEAAGVQVERVDPATGKQFAVELAGGWLRGRMDGRALGVPEAPKTLHVVETKTHNDRSFKELQKHAPPKGEGLKKSKPEHYAQCLAYLHGQGLTRCLYLAVNKNTEELYAERIAYDAAFALALEAKIERIARSDRAPPRLHEDPTSKAAFACAWCPAKPQCHEQAFARVNCRTCLEAQFRDGAEVWCSLSGKQLSYDEQQRGCNHHLFLPSLVPGSQSDANPELRTVTYQLADGSVWIDGVMK